ncbi:VOC family protein [Mucilaginibacter boryungensis]|uniref:VOC family protein n=1 Tax=Mucilaginibacter boryungensis TaxID=768480 RepID=A0ABR9XE19_9SPHI|nr:VOC family protein [Mucilaginibacter boryungensis]MBE9665422.1 VOC family protein [Mucilaginibacter boryungensis]
MSKPILAGIAPQVVVSDAKKTAEYYQNVLGFKLIGFFPSEVSTAYVMLKRDGFQIHFGGAEDINPHINDRIRCGTPDFLIWVPEIEAFYEEVTAKGAKIQQEIMQRSYGREFIIEDCDGHWLHVCD